MRKRTAVGALAVAATFGLAACGGDDDPTLGAGTEETSPTTAEDDDEATAEDFNDADVTFAQRMIVHHREAIDMAELADGRAESQEVLDLAEGVVAAQQPEIDQMESWLEAWGEEPMDEDMEGMDEDMEGMDSMPGAMSEEDMSALEAASGTEFDRMFLEMLIEHHRGAIEMAQTEVDDGQNPDAVALAEKIIEDQTAEIAEIEGILTEIG